MKATSLLIALALTLPIVSFSQRVGIGTNKPDSSAKLDVSSTNMGFLPPRMTFSQRNAIKNPASGLIVYCTTCGIGGDLQVFSNGSWKSMTNESTTDSILQPILTTNTITDISSSTAVAGGNISSNGGLPIIERGVVWSSNPNPTLAIATKVASGYGSGNFTSIITGLNNLTQYFVRAYAITAADTAYGNELTFTTVEVVANTSIASLKSLHSVAGQMDAIYDNIIISGIVTANDEHGNFYKEIYIEDSTGAIKVMLDATELYKTYPIGRRVYIYCKNLYISDYYRMMQLGTRVVISGAPTMQGIYSSDIPNYVKGGSFNNPITPTIVTLGQLGTAMSDSYLGRLVKMNDYEVIPADTNKTWADTSVYRLDQNINIQNCGSNSKTIIRTGGYADFAGLAVPKGNGSITSIYTVYLTTKQFIIRDTSDVQFASLRCGSGPITAPRITIGQLRQSYPGANARIKITNPTSISGIVISDASNGNISAGNFILQQGNAGILVYVPGSAISYNVGDSIIMDITNDSLVTYAGSLELIRMNLNLAPVAATGIQVIPAIKTIAEINAGLSKALGDSTNIEATLVKIPNVSFASTGTYGGSKTINDGTGTITLYTRPAASFSGATMPTNTSTITCYPLMFNTTKLAIIRNLGDLQ